jgi:hypothetical protein
MEYRYCFLSIYLAIIAIIATSFGISLSDDQQSCTITGSDLELIVSSGSVIAFVGAIVGLTFAYLEKKAGTVGNSVNIVFWWFIVLLSIIAIIIDFLTSFVKTDACTDMRRFGSLTPKGLIMLISIIHIILIFATPRSTGYTTSSFGKLLFRY